MKRNKMMVKVKKVKQVIPTPVTVKVKKVKQVRRSR